MRKRVQPAAPLERELAAAWETAAAAGPLSTTDGSVLRVVYPGRRNPEAGPDFVDAILATEAGEVRGAVELHRRTSDWERHGHSADPRYAGVVLHVVGRDDGVPGRLPGGGQLPLLELGPAGWPLDATGAVPEFPCGEAVRTGRDLLPALLVEGDRRFDAAAERLRRDLAGQGVPAPPLGTSSKPFEVRRSRFDVGLPCRDASNLEPRTSNWLLPSPGDLSGQEGHQECHWEQVVYEWLAAALGYSRNVVPMRELAAAVPLEEVCRAGRQGDALAAEALLLGSAGLLPSQRHLPAARRLAAYVEALEHAWRASGRAPALRGYRWDAGRVRPENAAVRRVVALAHLALRWPPAGLAGRVQETLAGTDQPPVANRRLAALVALPCPSGYWAAHWDFGVPQRREARRRRQEAHQTDERSGMAALIGPSRAADAVVNVLLPLAAAAGALMGDEAMIERARAAYRAHPPLAENWITRLVRSRTGLPAGRSNPVNRACTQQGLIAIYEGPCRDLRCGECPLGSRDRLPILPGR